MSLGSNIAEARKQRSLTQEKLAELVGVSFQAVSSWERDENLPDTARLLVLSKALDTSLDALFSCRVTDWKSSINDSQGLVERAIEFATVKHNSTKRKGTTIPYITHVVETLSIVSTLTEDQLQRHWLETPFAKDDPDFCGYIEEYIQHNLGDKGTSALLRCKDWSELCRINAENSFDDRLDESHDLYHLMQRRDLIKLAQIRKYSADNLLLYTHYWRDRENDSKAVDYICRLQERIPGCKLPAGVTQEVNLINSKPTKAQVESFESMIRALRSLPYECIHFTFMDPSAKDYDQIGLVNYHLMREKQEGIIASIRMDTKKGRRAYMLHTNDDYAVAILDEILIDEKVPDLSGWKDITDETFR